MANADAQVVHPEYYRTLGLDTEALRVKLASATESFETNPVTIKLPNPEGGWDEFNVVRYHVMEPALAAKYPQINTYRGVHITKPTTTVRLHLTPDGFGAMVTSESGRYFIDPFAEGNTNDYLAYKKSDLPLPAVPFTDVVEKSKSETSETNFTQRSSSNCTFKSYRLAIATTGEFSNFHGASTAGNASDEAAVMSAVVAAVNRLNEVYERYLSVRFVLANNTEDLFYYNGSTDPYTNNNPQQLSDQNQTNTDAVLGSTNYDIGHVLSTAPGGAAHLASLGQNGTKARGASGYFAPVGDAFYIDILAHQIGHQLGATHTFHNNCPGRNSSTAVEPGSGSTIMAVAGKCAPNVQTFSDDYFHGISVEQIRSYLQGPAGSVGTVIDNSNNPPAISFISPLPTVLAPPYVYVPEQSPLMFEASAIDPDGDPVLFLWEQMDVDAAGTATMPPSLFNGYGPLFRSRPPTTSNMTSFPSMELLKENKTSPWEVSSGSFRILEFRVTAFDLHNGIAGCSSHENTFLINGTGGPGFKVTSQNEANILWEIGQTKTITWNVGAATATNRDKVDILLSTDGGMTWNTTLVANTDNDGSANITVPNIEAAQARIMVKSRGNIFFDMNDYSFIIYSGQIECTTGAVPTVDKNFSYSSPTTHTSSILINETGVITDVNIPLVDVLHTWIGDLTMTLTSPAGTSVVLFNEACAQGTGGVRIGFDDQAEEEIPCLFGLEPGADDGQMYWPFDGALSAFNGEQMNGLWTMTMTDPDSSSGGRWKSWSLEICAVNIETCGSLVVTNANSSGPGSLPDAIGCAQDGDIVTFDPSLNGSMIQLNNTITISRNITILGPPTLAEIDGGSLQNAFYVTNDAHVEMANLEILSGMGPVGGAVQNMGDLRMTNVTVRIPGMQPSISVVDNSGMLIMNGSCIIQDQ